MAEVLSPEDFAGNTAENEETVRYTDFDTLKDLPDFEGNNKLHRIKLWHEPGVRITAVEMVYINPHTKDMIRPGAHICTGFDNDRMQEEVLEMELDEHIEEVRGFHTPEKAVHGVLLRSSFGRFVEVGGKTGQQFKFAIPRGDVVHSLNFGLSTQLIFLGLVTIPLSALPTVQMNRPPPSLSAATSMRPIIINRSEYFGAAFEDAMTSDDFFQFQAQHHLKRNRFRLISLECVFTDQRVLGLNVGYVIKKEKKFSSYNFAYVMQVPRQELRQDKVVLDEDEWLISFCGFATQGYISQLEVATNKTRMYRWGGFTKKSTKFDFKVPSETPAKASESEERLEKTDKMILALRGAFNTGGLIALMAYYVDANRDPQIRILE